MKYEGIIITGTKGSGILCICEELIKKFDIYNVVNITTTNKMLNTNHYYNYKINDEYKKNRDKSFIIEWIINNNKHGILHNDLEKVIEQKKIPIMLIPPEYLKRYEFNFDNYIIIFIDSNDDLLNKRLKNNGILLDDNILFQRENDRKYKYSFTYYFNNSIINDSINLINYFWEFKNKGGLLSKRIIQNMMECDILIINGTNDNIKSASYDLRLGDEYYSEAKIQTLGSKNPFIIIHPYDYAIVTSKELMSFPNDVAGRFDLTVSLFCQGIILSNGPQVDPGFRGRLFCLLFNTSNSSVSLKRNQHYSTLVLNKLLEPTQPYQAQYQDKEKISDYLPDKTMKGAIYELKKELDEITQQSKGLQELFLGVISLILSIIAILLATR